MNEEPIVGSLLLLTMGGNENFAIQRNGNKEIYKKLGKQLDIYVEN